MFTASECLQKYFLLHYLRNLFSQVPRFTHITCTGSICNHSLKCGCHFSTLDINAHFRILFIAKFEFLKLHSKVRSFERMFEFNQVRLGPTTDQRVDQRITFPGNIIIMPCAEGNIIIMPWLRGNMKYVAL